MEFVRVSRCAGTSALKEATTDGTYALVRSTRATVGGDVSAGAADLLALASLVSTSWLCGLCSTYAGIAPGWGLFKRSFLSPHLWFGASARLDIKLMVVNGLLKVVASAPTLLPLAFVSALVTSLLELPTGGGLDLSHPILGNYRALYRCDVCGG